MIKKQLCVLAGSIALAAGAQAAVSGSLGGADSSVMLALIDNDAALGVDVSTYWIEVQGVTADTLKAGTGFEFALSASAISFLSVADDYVLFANKNQEGVYDSVTSFDTFGDDVGTIYASASATGAKATFNALNNDRLVLEGLLGSVVADINAGLGEFGVIDGNVGDLAGSNVFGDILNPVAGITSLFYGQSNPAGRSTADPLETIIGTSVSIGASTVDANDIVFTTSAVPVPAAAWLFGSALLGLGVVRRKS